MSMLMTIPAQFLPAVLRGDVVRYGCILKEVATGRIVGHLKEVAGLERVLSSLPLNPWLAGVSLLEHAGQWLDTHAQLRHLRHTLEHLQLISSVGALASVAGLGVSVASFALLWRRLERLEQNLNGALNTLRAEIERLHLRMDLLSMAELLAARQQLDGAGQTERPERTAPLLSDADCCFQKYRNYYYALIMELQPICRPALSLPQVRELYGRFFACAQGELEANLLLNDFAQWQHRHEGIVKQLAETCSLDTTKVFACRAEALGLRPQVEFEELREQVLLTRDILQENHVRLLTAETEVRWLERQRLASADYLRGLHDAPAEEGVLLFPQDV